MSTLFMQPSLTQADDGEEPVEMTFKQRRIAKMQKAKEFVEKYEMKDMGIAQSQGELSFGKFSAAVAHAADINDP